MSAEITEFFSLAYLEETFTRRILSSKSKGLDGIGVKEFAFSSEKILSRVSQKILHGSFSFTPYRLKLISKGPGKPPREICIPTVRDRVVLRALCDYLGQHFEPHLAPCLPQRIVQRVLVDLKSKAYAEFIKLDVKDFYPSICHRHLQKVLVRYEVPDLAVLLIKKAIQTPWRVGSSVSGMPDGVGVPQGLSISNILASIYMLEMDKFGHGLFSASYYRYVDDLLLLVKDGARPGVLARVLTRFSSMGLEIHEPSAASVKSSTGHILTDEFGYLGYHFSPSGVTVRRSSVERLRERLVGLFVAHAKSKKKNEHLLQWRVNLRITGCILDARCKGWLFFFSEIDDMELMFSLDSFVATLAKRFKVKVEFKRFVRAYYEVRHSRYGSQYIPDFDDFPLEEMKRIMSVCWLKPVHKMSQDEISSFFMRRIRNEARDLETDLSEIAYKQ